MLPTKRYFTDDSLVNHGVFGGGKYAICVIQDTTQAVNDFWENMNTSNKRRN